MMNQKEVSIMSFPYNMSQDIDKHASTERIAIRWLNDKGERREVSYQELKEKSDQWARGLVEEGLQKGDRVMILLPRTPEAYFAYLACLKAGLIILPGSELLMPHDIAYRLKHAEVRAVIADEALAKRVDEAVVNVKSVEVKYVRGQAEGTWKPLSGLGGSEQTPLPQTRSDDIAFISYTSGTTGGPKGVIHHHSWGIAHQKTATEAWLDIRKGDVVWATAGPGWAKWVWSPFMSTLGAGATAFVYHGSFHPETYLSLLEQEKINVLCCTPTEYRMMAPKSIAWIGLNWTICEALSARANRSTVK